MFACLLVGVGGVECGVVGLAGLLVQVDSAALLVAVQRLQRVAAAEELLLAAVGGVLRATALPACPQISHQRRLDLLGLLIPPLALAQNATPLPPAALGLLLDSLPQPRQATHDLLACRRLEVVAIHV